MCTLAARERIDCPLGKGANVDTNPPLAGAAFAMRLYPCAPAWGKAFSATSVLNGADAAGCGEFAEAARGAWLRDSKVCGGGGSYGVSLLNRAPGDLSPGHSTGHARSDPIDSEASCDLFRSWLRPEGCDFAAVHRQSLSQGFCASRSGLPRLCRFLRRRNARGRGGLP